MYGLGDRHSQTQTSVETHLWWNGGWQLHWHRVVAYQPSVLRLGTHSLPLPEDRWTELAVKGDFAQASNGRHGIAIQSLAGFHRLKANESDPQKRTHILTWHSLILTAETEKVTGEVHLLALVYTGLNENERVPWKVTSTGEGRLTLQHPLLGEWQVAHPELPKLAV